MRNDTAVKEGLWEGLHYRSVLPSKKEFDRHYPKILNVFSHGRMDAAVSAGAFGLPFLVAWLTRWGRRWEAAQGLGHIGDKRAIPYLRKARGYRKHEDIREDRVFFHWSPVQ